MLSTSIATIASNEGLAPARSYHRIRRDWEIGILAAAVVLLTVLSGASDFRWNLAAVVIAGAACASQWFALGTLSIWLPGLPLLAAVLAAVATSHLITRPTAATPAPAILPAIVEIEPPPHPEPMIEVAAVEKTPALKAAKKSPPKKRAAKKFPLEKPAATKKAVKKTAAKKAVPKKKTTTEKPAAPRKPRVRKSPPEE